MLFSLVFAVISVLFIPLSYAAQMSKDTTISLPNHMPADILVYMLPFLHSTKDYASLIQTCTLLHGILNIQKVDSSIALALLSKRYELELMAMFLESMDTRISKQLGDRRLQLLDEVRHIIPRLDHSDVPRLQQDLLAMSNRKFRSTLLHTYVYPKLLITTPLLHGGVTRYTVYDTLHPKLQQRVTWLLKLLEELKEDEDYEQLLEYLHSERTAIMPAVAMRWLNLPRH